MLQILPKKLIDLAKACKKPLYLVGGAVRDFLAGHPLIVPDLDICSPQTAEEFIQIATQNGFTVRSVFQNTGTLKLTDTDGVSYEYSSFRTDEYIRGLHTPSQTYFTDDIHKDARRRDFTANAVYFDIASGCFVDPLDGITAIKEKRLTTVVDAKKVFAEDGLRLLRLARQCAQLGFTPDRKTLQGAKENAQLICDISPERIYTELCQLLAADEKYGNVNGAYHGLKILEEIGVFAHIFPALALGKGMPQRSDFHNYDVLEHSFQAVKYAPPHLRLAALLHDIGKPTCLIQDGKFHAHPTVGEKLARQTLSALKAPNRVIDDVCILTKLHMYDLDCRTSENKLRRFFVENYHVLPNLMALKQADFSACKNDVSPAPTCVKWQALLEKMQTENAPFTLKDLAVNGNDLKALGLPKNKFSAILRQLLLHTACNPKDNQKEKLCRMACKLANLN